MLCDVMKVAVLYRQTQCVNDTTASRDVDQVYTSRGCKAITFAISDRRQRVSRFLRQPMGSSHCPLPIPWRYQRVISMGSVDPS